MMLVREPIRKHWHLHRWVQLNGTVGIFSLVYQCPRCFKVKVTNWMTGQSHVGDHTMLGQP